MYIEITALLSIISFSVFTGMVLIISCNAFRFRRLADLSVSPKAQISRVKRECIETYLRSLLRALKLLKKKADKAVLPEIERWVNAYWIASVEALKERDEEETYMALRVLGYDFTAPYGELPPYQAVRA